jgi:hypothetical protein
VRFLLASLLVLSMLAAVEVAPAASPNVRGLVLRGPITPVCRADAACDAPMPGLPLVFTAAGVEVARARTDANGRFALALLPGTYRVRSARRLVFGGPIEQTFRVVAGQTTRLRLLLDTEIRTSIGGRRPV